jgi:hypothetical protein
MPRPSLQQAQDRLDNGLLVDIPGTVVSSSLSPCLQLPFVHDFELVGRDDVARLKWTPDLLFDVVSCHRIILSPFQNVCREHFPLVRYLYQVLLPASASGLFHANHIAGIQELISVIAVVDAMHPSAPGLEERVRPIIENDGLVAVYDADSW